MNLMEENIKCEICGKKFSSKDDLIAHLYDHLRNTELVQFPCPSCGTYHVPEKVIGGYAFMICSKCGHMYKTSNKVSLNFREFCSKVASEPNRSQGYYTKGEEEIRKYLESIGMIEGLDFIHNCRVKNGSSYYWLDFYLPRLNLALEYSPEVWHRMWNRQTSDERKKFFLENHGIELIDVQDVKDLEGVFR
jgi:transcription elongation factor Elf1